ncbi:hypothetical protein ASZ78_014589 [Callipepla squamata]|uniref:SCA7 domain-containing protein n=1 Tax=Callipepla squamata TaxID=9009 RepID=A0A226NL64_CALSU|nr:hypothetical protein ASZ78_014589 [Callipepla squamata]
MAAVGERRSLPSPEAMLGQPWSHWVDAAKLHGNDGTALEESFKEYGKNREAMRLCREDMPIFGLCPAHDDFYLVMCNHCNQVVKPQAFQSHYEREFDPDIYCGVIDVETKKPCTRSLTCKVGCLNRGLQAAQSSTVEMPRVILLLSTSPLTLLCLQLSQHLGYPVMRENVMKKKNLLKNWIVIIQVIILNQPLFAHLVVGKLEEVITCLISGGTIFDVHLTSWWRSILIHRCGSEYKLEGFLLVSVEYTGTVTLATEKTGATWLFVFPFTHRKIPPASSSTAAVRAPHRTNAIPASQYGVSTTGFLLPTTVMSSPALVSPSCTSLNNKSVPSHGTTLNANPATLGAVDPVCSMQSRQVSSSPSTPTVLSSVPSPMPSKPQKLKSSKSFKPKESSAGSGTCNSTGSVSSGGGSGKKRKNSSALLAPSHSTESFRKNCVVNSGNSGTSYHPSVTSSSHSVGLNCMTSKANSVSLKHDQSGRGPPTGSPAESIKRMSVMMNSSDSTLSLGPFVHQSSELTVNSHSGFSHSHPSLDKLIGKKRKCPPGSSSINSSSSSKSNKVAKLPSVNNVHAKHTAAIPGTQGLMNNSLLHQGRQLSLRTDNLSLLFPLPSPPRSGGKLYIRESEATPSHSRLSRLPDDAFSVTRTLYQTVQRSGLYADT